MDRTAVSGTSGGGSIPSGATNKTGRNASLIYFTEKTYPHFPNLSLTKILRRREMGRKASLINTPSAVTSKLCRY